MRIVLLFLISINILYADVIGNLSGKHYVHNGELNYNIPLKLPAGIAGHTPNISLHYNSEAPNGYLGMAWSLGGLSTITRCGLVKALDGITKGVKYNNEDNICLDGQLLVPVSGHSKWGRDSLYKTKVDSYSRIVYDGTIFKVYTKAGEKKEYTKINEIWYLTSVKDPYDNIITYTYTSTSKEVYLSQISYGGYKVVFNYSDRLDKISKYSDGDNIEITKRVNSILIKTGNDTVRTYKIRYEPQNTPLDKSIIADIKECKQVCINPISFEYQDTRDSFSSNPTYSSSIPDVYFKNSEVSMGTQLHDINGDGLLDIIQLYLPTDGAYGNNPQRKVYLNDGNKFNRSDSYTNSLPASYFESSEVKMGTQLHDIDGNGLLDIVQLYKPKAGSPEKKVYLNDGFKFTHSPIYSTSIPDAFFVGDNNKTMGTQFQDINGDGLLDLIQLYLPTDGSYGDNPQRRIHLNTGVKFNHSSVYSSSLDDTYFQNSEINMGTKLQDINGDGLLDIIQLYSPTDGTYNNYPQRRVFLNDGNRFNKDETYSNSIGQTYFKNSQVSMGTQLHDINGDGLLDIIQLYSPTDGAYNNNPQRKVYLNNGSRFIENETYSLSIPDTYFENSQVSMGTQLQDINGDGLLDIIQLYSPTDGTYNNIPQRKVYLNNGRRFNWSELYSLSLQDAYFENSEVSMGTKLQDINGDGLLDIIQLYSPSDGVYKNYPQRKIYLNNARKFVFSELYSDSIPDVYFENSEITMGTKLQDINGDGLLDIIQLYSPTDGAYKNYPQRKIYLNNSKDRKKLISITDSFKNEIKINYKYLSDDEVYTKKADATYPDKDIVDTKQVVSSIIRKTPTGEDTTTNYKYEGLRTNLYGLGSLGFSKMITTNELNNLTTITQYNQNYQYLGMVDKITKYMGNNILSSLTNEYRYTANNGYFKIYLEKTVIKDYQDAIHLKTTSIDNKEFDNYGNISLSETIILNEIKEEKFVKTIENKYINSENNWVIGRVKETTLTNQSFEGGELKYQDIKSSKIIYNGEEGQDDAIRKISNKTIIPDTRYENIKQKYIYDENGNLDKETIIADAKTISTSYTYRYNTNNILDEIDIENELKHKVTKAYNIDGTLKRIIDINKLKTSFEYDDLGNKTKEIRADGTTTDYRYTYVNTNETNPTKPYYKVKITNTSAPSVTNYYNSFGMLLESSKEGYGNKNIITKQSYDKYGNIYKKSFPYYDGEVPNYTQYTYDDYNRLKEKSYPRNDKIVKDEIDYKNYTVTVTNPLGQKKKTIKDALGRVIEVIDASGTDDESKINYTYDAIGGLRKTEDSLGNIIDIEYDHFGNKIEQKDPDMGIWKYGYNSLGLLKSQKDAKDQNTTMQYDELGRKIYEKTLGTNISSHWEYDTADNGIGKIHKEYKKDSSETKIFEKIYTYDHLSRVVSISTNIEGEKSFTKTYTYDTNGRVKNKTLPNGFELINEYDDKGYLLSIKSPKEQIADFDSTHFVNLIDTTLNNAKVLYEESLTLRDQATSKYVQVDNYRAIASNPSTNSSDRQTLNNTANQLEENANTQKLEADFKKKQSDSIYAQADAYINELQNSNATIDIADKESFYYTLAGYYTNYKDSMLSISQNYLNKTQSETNTKMKEYYLSISQESLSFSSTANDKAKNFESLAANYGVNPHMSLAQQEIINDTQYNYFYKVITYNKYDQADSYLSGNGFVTTFQRNDIGKVSRIVTGYEENNAIRDLEFKYDSLNNLTKRQDHKLGTTQDYTYDNLNRITSYTDNTISANDISYKYDLIGNITYKSDVSSNDYEYYDTNGITNHRVKQAGDKHYSYDQNGNVDKIIKISTNDNLSSFEYSSFNKPILISTPDTTVRFSYDMNKQRYKRVDDENTSKQTTTYYFDKVYENITTPSDNDGDHKYFIYVDGVVIAIYTDSTVNSSTKYLHYDTQNSIDTITSNLGVVEARMAYKPFGKKLNFDKDGNELDEAPFTNRGYTGHEHIENTPYIHMNGRVYDSDIAKFISPDPTVPNPYFSQDFNRYSYVRNNPLIYTDPTGYEPDEGDADYDDYNDMNAEHVAGAQSDAQATENDFNSSDEAGDGSGDQDEKRKEWEENQKEKDKKAKEISEKAFKDYSTTEAQKNVAKDVIEGMIIGGSMGATVAGPPGALGGALSGGARSAGMSLSIGGNIEALNPAIDAIKDIGDKISDELEDKTFDDFLDGVSNHNWYNGKKW